MNSCAAMCRAAQTDAYQKAPFSHCRSRAASVVIAFGASRAGQEQPDDKPEVVDTRVGPCRYVSRPIPRPHQRRPSLSAARVHRSCPKLDRSSG